MSFPLSADRTGNTTVSIRQLLECFGDELALEQLIPKLPGLYMWTRDLRMWLGKDEDEIRSLFDVLLGPTGLRAKSGAPPYYELSVHEIRRSISEGKLDLLVHWIRDANGSLGRWITTLGTEHQRPLYVGLARSLFSRIVHGHLQQQSVLRQRLESAGFDLSECAVTYMLLPMPVLDALAAPSEGDADERDTDLSVGDLEQDDKVTIIDRRLKAAESLLIRLTMPIFNLKQD